MSDDELTREAVLAATEAAMVSLRSIWERQLAFNKRFFRDNGAHLDALSPVERVKWSKEFVLHIENELHELLRTTAWKMHRISEGTVVRSNVREEWIDCLKFLIGLAQVWGFTPGEVVEEFHRKSSVVEYRYKMERRLAAISPSDPVVGVDIDGVLNDYPRSFLKWLLETKDEQFTPRTLTEVKRKLAPRRYQELKDEYRESGEKRNQGVREGAKELLDGLRAAGFTVVLLSRRPYWRYYRIYADTLEWLEANGLRCDAVLFHREKHRKILESFPKLTAMIEDDPKIAEEVRAAGYQVVLIRGELNVGVEGEDVVESPELALSRISVPVGRRQW